MPPLIGIPPCLDERGRWKPGRTYQYVDVAYAAALAEAGAVPVHLALGADPQELVSRLDGLLVPGGDDFTPPRPYPASVRFEPVPDEQLAADTAVLAAALARELPVLGICYGMQLLALAHGGSLHYHLETDLPGAQSHQLADPDGCHPVEIEPGTRLADCLGAGTSRVNSRHQQAVADAGSLRVCASAGDGVIEGVEAPGRPFCLGVQWHPENLAPTHRARLFGSFVAACS